MSFQGPSPPQSRHGASAEPPRRGRPYLRPLIAVGLCALAAVVALGALHETASSNVTPRAPIINQRGAETVLAQLWARREAALANGDESGLKAVDTGAALSRDMSNMVEALAQGAAQSGRPEPPLGPHFVSIGSGSRYPYSFLAGVQLAAPSRTSAESTFLLVVTKASSSSPWRVAMETSRGGTLEDFWHALYELLPEGEGSTQSEHVATPAKRAPAWTQPTGAIAALASYFQHYAEYGGPPAHSPFLSGPWTTQEGRFITENDPQYVVNRQGVRQRVTYSADWRDGVYTFPAYGFTITCGTIWVSSVSTPASPGGYLYQPPSRSNWGAELAPGAYQSIRGTGEHQACLSWPLTKNAVKVFSGEPRLDGSLGSVSGVPAPQAQPEAEPAGEPGSS